MAYIVMAYSVMAYIVMAYAVMAYAVMDYAVMAYVVMAWPMQSWRILDMAQRSSVARPGVPVSHASMYVIRDRHAYAYWSRWPTLAPSTYTLPVITTVTSP